MRSHWKPVVTLLLLTPFLTELLSGSLPAPAFFRPQVFLFLATVGYGFPVLLLREFAVRRQLGLAGLVLLGLVYGIFNEGIIAKTFYLAANVPIKNFDSYGYFGGIAVPWTVTISLWHALHSFLYPLAAVYYFFPNQRETPWLKGREMAWLAVPTAVIGTLIFFHSGQDREAGRPGHFILMLMTSGLLIWLAAKLPSAPKMSGDIRLPTRAVFLGGLGFLALVLVPVLMAAAKIPVIVFCGYNVLLIVFVLRRLGRRASLPTTSVLGFAIGDDLLLALFGAAGAMGQGNIERLITSACFILLFGWLIARLRRSGDGRTAR